MLIELAEMAKLAVFGCLEKYLFTLFCFELRPAQKSHCAIYNNLNIFMKLLLENWSYSESENEIVKRFGKNSILCSFCAVKRSQSGLSFFGNWIKMRTKQSKLTWYSKESLKIEACFKVLVVEIIQSFSNRFIQNFQNIKHSQH